MVASKDLFGSRNGLWHGILVVERLYIGSKSEGDYPILKVDEGQSFRLHLKAEDGITPDLTPMIGNQLLVTGVTDIIKGFRRIVTSLDEIQVIESSQTAEPLNTDAQNPELDGKPT